MLKRLKQCLAAVSAMTLAVPLLMTPLSAAAEETLYDIAKARILDAWENFDTRVYVDDLSLSSAEAVDLYFDVLFTNGEYFYVAPTTSAPSSISTGYANYIRISYSYDTGDIPAMQTAFDAAVDEAFLYYDPEWSTVEKLLYFHDYLAGGKHYNLDEQETLKYDAYNLLVEGTAVCQGYTLAMNVLCNRAGIPNGTIHSDTLQHIWNVVQVDGEWYHIDLTHDDTNPNRLGQAKHNFFLCSDTLLMADAGHQADDWIYYGKGEFPECSSTLYDDALWRKTNMTIVPYEDGVWLAGFPTTDDYSDKSSIGVQLCMFTFNSAGEMFKRPMYSHYDYWASETGYWQIYAGAVDHYNGISYFSDHNTIYQYTPDSGASTLISLNETDDAMYDIYGFVISNTGLLQYQLMDNPNNAFESAEIRSIQLEQPVITTTTSTTTTTTTPETTTTTSTTTTTTTPETTTTTSTTTTTTTTTETTTTTSTTTTTTTPETTTTSSTTTTTTTTETTTTTSTTTTTTTTETTTTTSTTTTTTTTETTTTTSTTTTTTPETTTTTQPPEPTILGDVNNDGYVMINDVILLNRYLAEDVAISIDAQGTANANFYNDDVINVADSVAILKYLAGIKE